MNTRNLIARCFTASDRQPSVRPQSDESSSLLSSINLPILNLLQLSQIKGGIGGQGESSEHDMEVVELHD